MAPKASAKKNKKPASKLAKSAPKLMKKLAKAAKKIIAAKPAAKPAKAVPAAKPAMVAAPAPVAAPVAKAKGKKGMKGSPIQTSILPSGLSKRGGGGGVKTRSDMISEAVCREVACEGLSTSGGYCRLHYIKNWKKIKRKEIILREGKLNQYIEELVAKYPDKYIEAIRHDLTHDKEFAKVITDLDLDETSDEFEGDQESVEGLIDNIKREFDDEGDAF